MRRTNTVGKPTVKLSPCKEWKISVIRNLLKVNLNTGNRLEIVRIVTKKLPK